MAIDASIPLGIKTGDTSGGVMAGIEGGMKLASLAQQIEASKQSVEASKASQALVEAQTPGAAADSEVKQRALRFNAWTQQNASKFRRPDGSVNTLAAAEAAKDAGFANEGLALAAQDLKAEHDRIANATDEQTRAHAQANFAIKNIAHAAMQADGLPEDQAGAILAKAQQFQNSLVPGIGDHTIDVLTKTVEVKDKDGKPVIGPDGQPLVKRVPNPVAIKAAKDASMTALEQSDLALRTARQNADFENSLQTPEGRSTTGPLANAAYAALRSQGYGEDKVPSGLSALQLKNMGYGDIIKDAVTGNKIPAATRQQQFNEGLMAQNDVKQIDLALQAVGRADNKTLATRPGSMTTDAFDKWIGQNPQYAGMKTAIVVHNSKYPSDQIDPATMSLGQIKAKLEQSRLRRQQDADTWLGASGMTQLPGNPAPGGVPSAAPQPQAAPQPAAPAAPQPAAPVAKAWTSKHLEELAKKSGMSVPALRALAAQKGITIKD